jgi:hypothetical protein
MIIANCGVSKVLSRLAIHLKCLDLSVIGLAVEAVVDYRELSVILLILEH